MCDRLGHEFLLVTLVTNSYLSQSRERVHVMSHDVTAYDVTCCHFIEPANFEIFE